MRVEPKPAYGPKIEQVLPGHRWGATGQHHREPPPVYQLDANEMARVTMTLALSDPAVTDG